MKVPVRTPHCDIHPARLPHADLDKFALATFQSDSYDFPFPSAAAMYRTI